jgi:multidrug resistance efflux pump
MASIVAAAEAEIVAAEAEIVAAAKAKIAELAAKLATVSENCKRLYESYDKPNKEYLRNSFGLDKLHPRHPTTGCQLPLTDIDDKTKARMAQANETVEKQHKTVSDLWSKFSQSKKEEQQLQANLEYCQGNLSSLQQLAATIAEAEATLSPTEAQLAIAEAKLAQIVGETTALDSLIEELEKARKSTDEAGYQYESFSSESNRNSEALGKINFKLKFAMEKRAELQPRLTFLQVDRVIKWVKYEL